MRSPNMENHHLGVNHTHCPSVLYRELFPSDLNSKSTCSGLDYLLKVVKEMQSEYGVVWSVDIGVMERAGWLMELFGPCEGIRYYGDGVKT